MTATIPKARLDDAVRRILRVKVRMGVFDETRAGTNVPTPTCP